MCASRARFSTRTVRVGPPQRQCGRLLTVSVARSLLGRHARHGHHPGPGEPHPQRLHAVDEHSGTAGSCWQHRHVCTPGVPLLSRSAPPGAQSLLTDPNPASPANPEAAQVYLNDRAAFNRCASSTLTYRHAAYAQPRGADACGAALRSLLSTRETLPPCWLRAEHRAPRTAHRTATSLVNQLSCYNFHSVTPPYRVVACCVGSRQQRQPLARGSEPAGAVPAWWHRGACDAPRAQPRRPAQRPAAPPSSAPTSCCIKASTGRSTARRASKSVPNA